MFGANLDKRELQAALPSTVYQHNGADELWFDYIADVGDGFDATYSMAWLVGQPSLTVPGPDGTEHVLPRGRVLVMGGDEVYPTPSWPGYEDRTKGPYLAAFPQPPAERPALYALPGNHDWYDGLTSFLRLFAKGSRFGGWRTRQSRSYFALSLPHRWWLFAIDSGLDFYLDDPQLEYFRTAANSLRTGDKVILCISRPEWVYGAREPQAYNTTDYFIRKIIEPTGATVPVMLSGDLHHYARYERTDGPACSGGQAPATDTQPSTDQMADAQGDRATPPESDPTAPPKGVTPAAPSAPPQEEAAEPQRRSLITCGGGGAFLYPTHLLPRKITVPPEGTLRRAASPSEPYRLDTTFPTEATSRRYGWGIFRRLMSHNLGFAAVLGVLHTLLMYAYITAGSRILSAPVIVLSLVTLGSTIAFAMSETDIHHRPRHWIAGFAHGLAHLGLAALGAYLWWSLPLVHLAGPLPVLLSVLIYLPVAGLISTELTALYLFVAGKFGVNVNELFAGQGIKDSKSFLRLRIDADGALTIYPIGLDRAGRHWVADPDGDPESSWIAPTRPLRPRLIDEPQRH